MPANDLTMRVFIFSFSRGKFLQNCLDSLEQAAPELPVTIYDDGSEDPETIAVLTKALDRGISVFRSNVSPGLSQSAREQMRRRGGLHRNMQAAFESCDEDYYWFMQDDTQACRILGAEILIQAAEAFSDFPQSAFLHVQFLKATHQDNEFNLVAGRRLYVRRPRVDGYHAFTDTHVGMTKRLRDVGWEFGDSEKSTAILAEKLFGYMPHLADPWSAFLPFPPTLRFRGSGLIEAWLQKHDTGFYPLQMLDHEASSVMLSRDPQELPYAEHFLTADGLNCELRPWRYQWSPSGPVTRALVAVERRVIYKYLQ